MSEIVNWVSDSAKDASSHVTVAALITFSHENKIVTALALIGVTIIALAWMHHGYKMYKQHKAARS